MRRSLLLAVAILGPILDLGCGRTEPDPVREYIRLAVALGERDPQSLDYYYGPAEWVADIKAQPPTFAEIAKRAHNVASTMQVESDLKKQLRAVAARAERLAGATLPFDEEAKRLFAALADGGEVRMPLNKTFFSPCFGMVADRFGVAWMVITNR